MLLASLAVLAEDSVVRGYLMNQLDALRYPVWSQVLLSSALFALYHSVWSLSIASFIASLILGLILAGLFIWGKRSLIPVVLAHVLILVIGEPFLTMSLLLSVSG